MNLFLRATFTLICTVARILDRYRSEKARLIKTVRSSLIHSLRACRSIFGIVVFCYTIEGSLDGKRRLAGNNVTRRARCNLHNEVGVYIGIIGYGQFYSRD